MPLARSSAGSYRCTTAALVPLAGSSAGGCCDSMAALGDRGAGAGFGVKPRENEEGRSGEAAPRSGAKRRPDFWRAALMTADIEDGHHR
ncbi:MAG TPA: hypothetical protein VKP30_09655, partial [Polyangiaceae bacterium]|nr:hypothetical protein [Polyangiaceae bacterium]